MNLCDISENAKLIIQQSKTVVMITIMSELKKIDHGWWPQSDGDGEVRFKRNMNQWSSYPKHAGEQKQQMVGKVQNWPRVFDSPFQDASF